MAVMDGAAMKLGKDTPTDEWLGWIERV